jgi:arylsulfatase A-like enzyme
LPPGETTIAEVLKQAGYATACVGKWHLGWRMELRPQQQGFDEFFGLLHTNDTEEWEIGQPFTQLSMFEPLQLRDGDRVVQSPVDQAALTQRYTEWSIDFIRRHRQRPFFLYLAHTMPHVPQYASPAFAGKSKDGIYGDSIEELDWSTGKLLDTLKELGLDENTLVIFTSDNGASLRGRKPNAKDRFPGHSFGGSNGPLRAGKGTTFEGGVRVPCIARWPGKVPAVGTESSVWTALDFLPTFAALAGAKPSKDIQLDGQDVSTMLLS